jgi:hypothetical protein
MARCNSLSLASPPPLHSQADSPYRTRVEHSLALMPWLFDSGGSGVEVIVQRGFSGGFKT